MAYNKTNWTETTPINTTNLNKIENGIEAAQTKADNAHPKITNGTAVWEWKVDANGLMYIEQVQ